MDRRTAGRLIESLNRDGEVIAERFSLRYRAIEAERANVRRRYGVCYSDGTIRIRLRHVATGQPLKYSSLVSTLCHELAHLRHFNHGERFRRFYALLLEFARNEGIYRPSSPRTRQSAVPSPARERPSRPEGPRQLTLFG